MIFYRTKKTEFTTYRKKSFAGVKGNAAVENVYAVADAVKAVMKNPTRNYYLNDSNLLDNDEE